MATDIVETAVVALSSGGVSGGKCCTVVFDIFADALVTLSAVLADCIGVAINNTGCAFVKGGSIGRCTGNVQFESTTALRAIGFPVDNYNVTVGVYNGGRVVYVSFAKCTVRFDASIGVSVCISDPVVSTFAVLFVFFNVHIGEVDFRDGPSWTSDGGVTVPAVGIRI